MFGWLSWLTACASRRKRARPSLSFGACRRAAPSSRRTCRAAGARRGRPRPSRPRRAGRARGSGRRPPARASDRSSPAPAAARAARGRRTRAFRVLLVAHCEQGGTRRRETNAWPPSARLTPQPARSLRMPTSRIIRRYLSPCPEIDLRILRSAPMAGHHGRAGVRGGRGGSRQARAPIGGRSAVGALRMRWRHRMALGLRAQSKRGRKNLEKKP